MRGDTFKTWAWKCTRYVQTLMRNMWKFVKDDVPWGMLSGLASLATLGSLWFLIIQTKTQIRQVEMENRPYLYVDVKPAAYDVINDHPDGSGHYELYLGAALVYKNVGKTPACNIKTELHMYNDAVRTDDAKRLGEWFVNTLGARPKVSAVFPQETVPPIPLMAVNISVERPTQYWITIRVSYTGNVPKKTYWYSFDGQYHIDESFQTHEVRASSKEHREAVFRKHYRVLLLDTNTNYDGFGQFRLPAPLQNPYLEATP